MNGNLPACEEQRLVAVAKAVLCPWDAPALSGSANLRCHKPEPVPPADDDDDDEDEDDDRGSSGGNIDPDDDEGDFDDDDDEDETLWTVAIRGARLVPVSAVMRVRTGRPGSSRRRVGASAWEDAPGGQY